MIRVKTCLLSLVLRLVSGMDITIVEAFKVE